MRRKFVKHAVPLVFTGLQTKTADGVCIWHLFQFKHWLHLLCLSVIPVHFWFPVFVCCNFPPPQSKKDRKKLLQCMVVGIWPHPIPATWGQSGFVPLVFTPPLLLDLNHLPIHMQPINLDQIQGRTHCCPVWNVLWPNRVRWCEGKTKANLTAKIHVKLWLSPWNPISVFESSPFLHLHEKHWLDLPFLVRNYALHSSLR